MEMIEVNFSIPNIVQWLHDLNIMSNLSMIAKMLLALTLGALIGYEREKNTKPAGLRTHMLVALGAAIFTISVTTDPRSSPVDLAQVVKGIAAGVGFLGAGAILKGEGLDKVKGLTTASAIWLCAAIGLTIGSGHICMGICGAILTWFVLGTLDHIELAKRR